MTNSIIKPLFLLELVLVLSNTISFKKTVMSCPSQNDDDSKTDDNDTTIDFQTNILFVLNFRVDCFVFLDGETLFSCILQSITHTASCGK
jgi:hypothetical protein